jgi:hypothetical protein
MHVQSDASDVQRECHARSQSGPSRWQHSAAYGMFGKGEGHGNVCDGREVVTISACAFKFWIAAWSFSSCAVARHPRAVVAVVEVHAELDHAAA